MILRCCYHQILGPRRHLPKFAHGCYRHSDIWVRLDPHLTWQATKSYVERGNAFGLILHQSSLTIRSGSFGPPAARGTRSGRNPEHRDKLAPLHVEHGGLLPSPPVGEAGLTTAKAERIAVALHDQPAAERRLGSSMWAKANTLRRDRHSVGADERAR